MKKYNHKQIEKKWQEKWVEDARFKTKEDNKDPKKYILDMFPYPSGDGLHVGHPRGYIASDVFARFNKMKGFNVLHPMGWDAFGLPAENFAIKHKVHPKKAVAKNIAHFKSQLQKIGFTYDWDREINTTDPDYYKWTQWIFLQLYKSGYAYESYEPINWCPSCKTGLANEDLEDGKCELCGSIIEKKPLRQWMLKITDYAEKLLSGIDDLNWPESIKESQRNWIGKSSGSELNFELDVKNEYVILHGYGGSPTSNFIPWLSMELKSRGHDVVAPELPNSINPNIEEQVKYLLDNVELNENSIIIGHSLGAVVALKALEKSGLHIKKLILVAGFINPKSKDKEVHEFLNTLDWVFDFDKIKSCVNDIIILRDSNDSVVPHVEGDRIMKKTGGRLIDFTAQDEHVTGKMEPTVLEYALGAIKVFTTRPDTVYGATYMVLSPEHDTVTRLSKQISNWKEVEKYRKEVSLKTEIERTNDTNEKTGVELKGIKAINPASKREIPVWIADYVLSNYGTGAIMAVPRHDERDFEFAKKFKLPMIQVIQPHNILSLPRSIEDIAAGAETGLRLKSNCWMGEGVMINSGTFNGKNSEDVKVKITEHVGGKMKTTFKLRDWVFSRQRYWGEPIPIIHCESCGSLPVPESDLPVLLPEVDNYLPTGSGESPLANIKEWVETICPNCSEPAKRETNTMPQWAGSSWYYLRFMDPFNKAKFVGNDNEIYWSPVDVYVGGAEHATRHLIYARFWHKFLFDKGHVSKSEPFQELKNVGMILAEDGRKMSKRWKNVINPDDIINLYGADTLRVYEMFMGPFDQSIKWNTSSIMGARRFIERVWRLADNVDDSIVSINKTEIIVNKTIKKVTEDIENFRFNTAISQLMILLNNLEGDEPIALSNYEILLLLLYPFAPHITEELWEHVGFKESIYLKNWPHYDKEKLQDDSVTFVIQINGKVRSRIIVNSGLNKDDAIKSALRDDIIKKWLDPKNVVRYIYIQDKLLNIVTKIN